MCRSGCAGHGGSGARPGRRARVARAGDPEARVQGRAGRRSGTQTGPGESALRIPPERPGGQDLVEREWLWWLCLPLSAPWSWLVLRPLSAFCPRLASLSYSVAARVRALVTYPPARLGSELTEFSLRHLVSRAVSPRSVSEASTPAPAAACTGLLAASLRISALTSMVRLITDLTFPGLPPGQALVRCA